MTFHVARARGRRWGNDNSHWGPFTLSEGSGFSVTVQRSVFSECGTALHVEAFGRTLICELPNFIRPLRCYGFDFSDGGRFLQVFCGRRGLFCDNDSTWSKHLPWTQWRHVRTSLYGLSGEHYATEAKGQDFREWFAIKDACPKAAFSLTDFDGELIHASAYIEEMEWTFGTGWFKWLRFFRRPMIRRSLWVDFDKETGKKKGSWKGGTTGCGIDMSPGELHREAFIRMCAERGLTPIQ